MMMMKTITLTCLLVVRALVVRALVAHGACTGSDEPVDDMALLYNGVASLSDDDDEDGNDEGAAPALQAVLAAAPAPQVVLAAAPAPHVVLAAVLAAPVAPTPSKKKRVMQPESDKESDEDEAAGMAGLSAKAIAEGAAGAAA